MDIRPSMEIASCEELVEKMLQSCASAAFPPIKSMKLLKSVNLEGQHLESVCHYGRFTYAGRENAVDKINPDGTVESSFITVDGYSGGIAVLDEKIFVLVQSLGYRVQVHNRSGHLIRSWNTDEENATFNKLTVIGDKVVVPEPSSKQFVVYRFDGKVQRVVECHLLRKSSVFGSAVSLTSTESHKSHKTIACAKLTGTVFRIDIESGEVVWESTHVKDPQGIACYKDRYVLVTNRNQYTRIFILDINTG